MCEDIFNKSYGIRYLDDLSSSKLSNVEPFMNDNESFEFVKGDIKNFDTSLNACEDVDFVLNQAAWISVPRFVGMPLFYYANNITRKIIYN